MLQNISKNKDDYTLFKNVIEIPMTLSKKLYMQNIDKYCIVERYPSRYFGVMLVKPLPMVLLSKLTATMTAIDKYTIVELTYNGKHYHGLAARANCDNDNGLTGIAIAYNRAFKALCNITGK